MQLSQRPRFVLGISSLLALAVVASIVIVVFPYWRPDYWKNKSALEERFRSAQQNGMPVRFSDLATEDSAGKQLATQVSTEIEKLVAIPDELLNCIEEGEMTGGRKDLLLKYLARNEKTLARIDALKPLSACRYSYDFSTPAPMSLLLPHVTDFYKLRDIYRARFYLAMESKDVQSAIDSVIDTLESTETLTNDPFLVSQAVRIKIGQDALTQLATILQTADLSAEQFHAIDALLQNLESNFLLKNTINSEAAMCFTSLENISHSSNYESLVSMVNLGSGNEIQPVAQRRNINRWASLAYKPQLMAQQIWMLDQFAEMAKLIDEPGREAASTWQATTESMQKYLNANRGEAIAALTPAIAPMRESAFQYRHHLLLSRIALRLDRYHAQHGTFPDDISTLVDNTLPTLPNNLWTDEAVQYKCEEGKCELSYNYFNGQEIDTVSITLTK